MTAESWSIATARLAAPILVEIAQRGEHRLITYGELHERVIELGGKAHVGSLIKYATPLGRIASAIEAMDEQIPPLTAIVVSASTGLPSEGIDLQVARYLKLDTKYPLGTSQQRRTLMALVWNRFG